MERFAGKVAVVTGASGGIPSAITRELLKWNLTVVGLDVNMDNMKAFQDELFKNAGTDVGKFYPLKCDITNDDEIRKTFDWIKGQLKSVSILINGAGIASPQDNDLQKVSAELFDTIFGANAKGTILCAKEAMNLMMENSEPGHIINICSITGYDTHCHQGNTMYVASKHAVRVFSDGLRREITRKRANIKVTTLSPGLVSTELAGKTTFGNIGGKEEILKPEDIAKGCISILNTPHHVLASVASIEFQID
ncbi:hypothetical protein V9T40_003897 [Parthenolecanium corni]|uniref:Uncharacterized protein n=1 Tax=Parthenolecanium corni TaxID=536013 RepID=A0AAN9TI02_9HEMI